ncbi:MAG: RNA pseudouridine synthase, partial [Pyrinomonadaceae bacterium]
AYLAICQPGDFPDNGTIDLPLLTASSGRIRVAAERQHIEYDSATGTWHVKPVNLLPRKNYPSRTDYVNLWDDGQNVVVLAMPVTGRRHQIRVHFAWVGHAIFGDPLFTKKTDEPTPRTYLHSLLIAFETADSRPEWAEVKAKPGADFWEPVNERLAPRSSDELLAAADTVLSGQGSVASTRTANPRR